MIIPAIFLKPGNIYPFEGGIQRLEGEFRG